MKSIKNLLSGLIVILPLLAGFIPPADVAQAVAQPGVVVTYVPACGTRQSFRGFVTGVVPKDYKIAAFISVPIAGPGWWNKPGWAKPLTKINSKSKWSANVINVRTDVGATKFAAFLVANGYTPPTLVGDSLPDELYSNAVAYVIKTRHCEFRELEFSGYTWQVREATGLEGPGPNYFSNNTHDVFVDGKGRLHMKIVKRGGKWYSTEVINESVLGYGKYVFHIAQGIEQLDPSAVLGLFTWDNTSPDYFHREIDIEFSRWGVPGDLNSQFVVQPYTTAGNIQRFNTILAKKQKSTHGFDWQPSQISFQSLYNDQPFPGIDGVIQSWTYTDPNIPLTGAENVRINLWLFNGAPPTNKHKVEVIIDRFEFIPFPPPAP